MTNRPSYEPADLAAVTLGANDAAHAAQQRIESLEDALYVERVKVMVLTAALKAIAGEGNTR